MEKRNRGVSSVLGVVLMVAVVVVLAAAISVVVLGVGEALNDPVPTVAFDEKQEADGTVLITQTAGDTIDRQHLSAKGGEIDQVATPKTIAAGDSIEIEPKSGSEEVTLLWGTESNSAILASVSEVEASVNGPAIVTQTDADQTISVRAFGENKSKEQFDELNASELTDPFTLAVKAPELAGEESTDFAVTAFYDGFNGNSSDRLSGPSTPLDFDENGIASVTIGSQGTGADVTTSIAFGPLSDDASLVNNIEVPDESEAVAVETE